MPNLRDPNAPRVRVTIDLTEEQAEFVDRFASYRNELALEQNGVELKVKWKRKLMTEDLVKNAITQENVDLELLHKALGPFPGTKAEMKEYAKHAKAWLAKRGK